VPIDYSRYPTDWPEIRRRILERAGHKCEWCGVANHAVGARDKHDRWHDDDDIHSLNSDVGYSLFNGEFPEIIRIVLTIAHIENPDPMDCREENLKALCQRCHLRHDNSPEGRRRKRIYQGQMEMAI
jgi:5-methylcytosine-specific restriction endonuclease McrA